MNELTPVRLDAVDPTRNKRRFESLIANITHAAAPQLAGRRLPRTPLAEIERMYRPLLAAAAAIVLFAGVSLFATSSSAPVADQVLATEDGQPSYLTFLMEEQPLVTLDDLMERQHEASR